ncbi:MAG: glycosyltransferase [Candidatus Methanoculleus thermohydrogenotrophicum]|jgi:dolichol-phosphate mannosyltransferase|nr:glycosyltransferase [Candidatus Methanoculleus thermohydrogenotrophicum]NLM82823.1 glycosyltransferase [Candidatus Methanoculleus thermohydrogenotrophicum]HQC91431.1 glycosyltransferase [Candidatus Methanoculleus thermohydrogenotrophicum]
MLVSIIVPLYNEEDNVDNYELELFPVVDEIAERYNISINFVFIDDGSKDQTLERINAIAARRENILVLHHDTNRGMGAALKTGFAHTDADLIITMDADLTFRPEDISALLEAYFRERPECVSGSPYLQSGLMKEVAPIRLFLSKTVNFMYRMLLRQPITCVSPIFRLYRAETLKKLDLESENFEINAEIISKYLIFGYRVVEIPVELHKRRYGESKINIRREVRNNLKMMRKIVRTKYFHQPWRS